MVAIRQTRPFELGKILSTPAALEAVEAAGQCPLDFLLRHARHDWGEVSVGDAELIDDATVDGDHILSAYHTCKDVCVWIITEADRSCTTILLPGEY